VADCHPQYTSAQIVDVATDWTFCARGGTAVWDDAAAESFWSTFSN
jgi:hypothetical protein